MITYRLFCLKDGRIASTTIIEAADDVAATEVARRAGHDTDCELWCDGRLVAFIPTPGANL